MKPKLLEGKALKRKLVQIHTIMISVADMLGHVECMMDSIPNPLKVNLARDRVVWVMAELMTRISVPAVDGKGEPLDPPQNLLNGVDDNGSQ